jgi:hypothetical protein
VLFDAIDPRPAALIAVKMTAVKMIVVKMIVVKMIAVKMPASEAQSLLRLLRPSEEGIGAAGRSPQQPYSYAFRTLPSICFLRSRVRDWQ